MADTDRLSGKASYLTFNSVAVPITKRDVNYNRVLGETTDSADYNVSQDMLTTTQIPIKYQVEGSIEFRYRLSVTPALIAIGVTSLTQIPCVFGLNGSFVEGHGLVDLFNIKITTPVEDVIVGTADIKSWGAWVPNA